MTMTDNNELCFLHLPQNSTGGESPLFSDSDKNVLNILVKVINKILLNFLLNPKKAAISLHCFEY